MRLQVKAKGFELTPALTQFIEEKMAGLTKLLTKWDRENVALLDVEVAKTTKHHNKGNVFYAEANLQIPNAPLLRIEETNEDLHMAIVQVKDRLKNELSRFKEKLAEHRGSGE
jgi:ribosomal subunit interface protein